MVEPGPSPTSAPGPSALLAGRHAVVTGGASGLGAAVVARFAREGASGWVLDLPGALGGALPGGWRELGADVRDETALARAFATVGAAGRPVDALVAAAGIVPPWADVASVDLAELDEVLRVNARGVLATIQRALPLMGARSAIVVIGSLNSWRGDPNLTTYVASKHAVLGIVRAAALDLGRRGIRVNAVGPGPIATDALLARMARRHAAGGVPVEQALREAGERTALGRIATAEEVAAAVLFLAGPDASGITGHLLPVDAGIA
jgi:NAD(P)-dependent dehydrogenase (short-subunit alcohol dehydrogenase family)